MKKVETVKLGVDLVVGIGVGMIAGNAIGIVTPVTGGVLQKICTKAGAIALESLIVSKTTNYVDEKIDEINEQIQKAVDTKV